MKCNYLIVVALSIGFCNCKKETAEVHGQQETNILTYSLQGVPTLVTVDASRHEVNIRFPDSIMNAVNLVADFTLSPGCRAVVKNVEQVSGLTKNSFTKTFYYTVSASGSSSDWKVTASNNDYTAALGLGNFIGRQAVNDRSYAWYLDQMYTGPYSWINCGPTAVTMACKWADSLFAKTPEDARNAYRPDGGYWYADDITGYLRDNNIPNSTLALPANEEEATQILTHQVDVHQVAILILDMNYVNLNSKPTEHVDRFYSATPGFGHCILVKGYIEVDTKIYFDVYDPYSFGNSYDDGSGLLKGKDRYYRSEDLFTATQNYWPKIFIVAKKGATVIE
ncbi:MAG TPA: hypothetical protein PKM63_01445 [Panacibacter sp.]|nr:hypothetical protein [Panacibacter sp.]HNP42919.1 hypothetical protein [Panacibacter sp.]